MTIDVDDKYGSIIKKGEDALKRKSLPEVALLKT